MSAGVVKGSLKKAIANELDGEATFVVRFTPSREILRFKHSVVTS